MSTSMAMAEPQVAAPAPLPASTRDLVRLMRTLPSRAAGPGPLPESTVWQAYVELRRRGEPRAEAIFLRAVHTLHRRRSFRDNPLPLVDDAPQEHKLVEDPMLGELWKAYKRCICGRRMGPAAQLLRDIETHLTQH